MWHSMHLRHQQIKRTSRATSPPRKSISLTRLIEKFGNILTQVLHEGRQQERWLSVAWSESSPYHRIVERRSRSKGHRADLFETYLAASPRQGASQARNSPQETQQTCVNIAAALHYVHSPNSILKGFKREVR